MLLNAHKYNEKHFLVNVDFISFFIILCHPTEFWLSLTKQHEQLILFLFFQKESCLDFMLFGFSGLFQGREVGFKQNEQIGMSWLENLRLKWCILLMKCKLLNMQWLLLSVQNNLTLFGMTCKTFLLLETHSILMQKVRLLCTYMQKNILLENKSLLKLFDTIWTFLCWKVLF